MDITEADYMELVDRKTASLFSACARLGAIAAGADESNETLLGDFAWNLGMAFQLVDDILDFTSTEKILGKPAGNDLREGKITLPLIYALEKATAEDRKCVESILTDGNYENVPFMQILQLLDHHKSIERAYERAPQLFRESAAPYLRIPGECSSARLAVNCRFGDGTISLIAPTLRGFPGVGGD